MLAVYAKSSKSTVYNMVTECWGVIWYNNCTQCNSSQCVIGLLSLW